MNVNADCRAMQHLLVQGFALIPCAAAVCARLVAPSLLEEPRNTWAVICDATAHFWTAQLASDDPLLGVFAEAAIKARTAPHVICFTQGQTLVLPLQVSDIRDARMRIEAAIALSLTPPTERLEAYPDELIEREAKRRKAKKNGQGDSGSNEEQGSDEQTAESEASST